MSSFFSPSSQPETVTEGKGNKHTSGVVLRRLKFIASATYWSVRHHSVSRGVWVANFCGYTW